MNVTVTEQAAAWYKDELEIEAGTAIRFFVRYGGVGGIQPGFSLGIKMDEPREPVADTEVNGIRFFIESEDDWYFDDHSLKVDYNEKWEEPDFHYEK
ncbi:HesB/YadR/YfhF family protein [Thalassobacillus hwangdonensis]|uniref:HesB/YadR/YfhF family protein n=1 Tax=Thalassobacillus hwangdonensis TaxID=546108 RepID=A0ABW3KWR6_9BACI